MISEKQLPELRAYRHIESRLPVENAPLMHDLLAPAHNEELPIHRWFRFKEGFSAELLQAIVDAYLASKDNISIHDPFCGSGTTLVSAQQLSRERCVSTMGIERNPFIHFIAKTKTSWPLMDSDKILSIGESVLENSSGKKGPIPRLSSLTTGRCMSRHSARRLVAIRDAIFENGSSPNHSALMLGLASAIEQLSRTRKDGRALRLVTRGRQNIEQVLRDKWNQIAADIRLMRQAFPDAHVAKLIRGDGRAPSQYGILPESIDIVLTSPPYPNNIDYSEVYKLELWLLGFIRDGDEFLELRKTTFRSHPTAAPPRLDQEFRRELRQGMLRALVGPIVRRTNSSPDRFRQRLILGYAADLWQTLREHEPLIKRGGFAAVVVGNSLHGGIHLPYLIPTDLVLSAIATRTGYRVEKIAIARNFRRRLSGNHFLRESVVLLRKE